MNDENKTAVEKWGSYPTHDEMDARDQKAHERRMRKFYPHLFANDGKGEYKGKE